MLEKSPAFPIGLDPAPLRAAAELPHVIRARQEAEQTLSALRFHEGLRRQWEAARAEAAIREAAALSLLEGGRISVDDLRALSMQDASDRADSTRDPAQALAVGIWRAQWNLASGFAPLNARIRPVRRPRPIPALMSALHRDISSGMVEAGLMEARDVAFPVSSHPLRKIVALLHAPLPAWVCAAEVCAHFRATPIFRLASSAMGATLARWVLVERGVDPTGVAVISAFYSLEATQREDALHAWKEANSPDISQDEALAARSQWYAFFARSVTEGARIGQDIALHVQAGRLQ